MTPFKRMLNKGTFSHAFPSRGSIGNINKHKMGMDAFHGNLFLDPVRQSFWVRYDPWSHSRESPTVFNFK